MSTVQWILSIVLLGWALSRNLGTREITRSTFVLPIAIVVVVGGYFLQSVPTQGNDVGLVLAGGAIGVALGLAAGAVTRLDHREGKAVATAGFGFAGLWIAMILGRIVFAEWATGAGARTIGQFSMDHAITGPDAWTAAFVVMALGMVLVRTAHLAARTAVASSTALPPPPTQEPTRGTDLDHASGTPEATGATGAPGSPAWTVLGMAGLTATASIAGALIITLLAPQADQMTRRLVVVLGLAAAALVWSARIGWSHVGAGGPSSWCNVRLLWVPAAVACVPLAWGWSPPAAGALAVLAVGYTATAVYEELWFRGIMLRAATPMGPVRAATATGVLFGLSHLTNIVFGQNVWVTASQAIGATAFGFGYAILRWRTNALWLLVVIHAVGDLVLHSTALHGGALALVLVGHDLVVFIWGLLLTRGASRQPQGMPLRDDLAVVVELLPHPRSRRLAGVRANQWASATQPSVILRGSR